MAEKYDTALIVDGAAEPVILLEIQHPSLNETIRIARDTDDFTHNGNTYIGVSFGFAPPPQYQTRLPKAMIWIDRYTDDVIEWIDRANGGRDATFKIIEVLRETPDIVETEISLIAKSVSYDSTRIVAELTFDYRFNRPFCAWRFTRENAPGLFS